MILAGDIGGTKTVLSLLTQDSEGLLSCLKEQSYPSQQYSKFDEILNDFLSEDQEIASACFGIAGPVVNQRCQTTNLPWLLDGNELKARLNTSKVKLLNDLEAMALGMKYLPDDDLVELNPNAIPQTGNVAVIAAGTGLGEAILFWDGITYHPLATEGGHTDFAAQNELQDQLLKYLRKKNPEHVSYERILAGVGFLLAILLWFLIRDYPHQPTQSGNYSEAWKYRWGIYICAGCYTNQKGKCWQAKRFLSNDCKFQPNRRIDRSDQARLWHWMPGIH